MQIVNQSTLTKLTPKCRHPTQPNIKPKSNSPQPQLTMAANTGSPAFARKNLKQVYRRSPRAHPHELVPQRGQLYKAPWLADVKKATVGVKINGNVIIWHVQPINHWYSETIVLTTRELRKVRPKVITRFMARIKTTNPAAYTKLCKKNKALVVKD